MGFRFSNLPKLQKSSNFIKNKTLIHGQNHLKTINRCHVSHSHHDHNYHVTANDSVFKLGLAADVALAAGKSVTGYLSGSTAILADAAHSISDIVLSSVAWLSFKAGKAPKDKEHPYGHGKFETLGTLGISCMLLATSGGIAWHAIDILQGIISSSPDMVKHIHNESHSHGGHHHGFDLEHPILALSMTSVSISVKEWLYWITKKAGEREGSELMKANAWHHRSDAVSSVVALVGVGGTILGVPFLDPVAGIFVSGMILKAGVETGHQSIMELVDAAVPFSVLAPIKETITQVEGVKGCHRLRGRKAGSFMYLDVHIEVDPFLSVSAAHDIGETVRNKIQENHKHVSEVYIHIDPSYTYCSSLEDQRKKIEDIENLNYSFEDSNAEAIASGVITTLYAEKMTVEHITRHSLKGKILLEIQVSMPLELSIRDAKRIADEAEKEILKAAPCINMVSIELRLGSQIPLLHSSRRRDNVKQGSESSDSN